MLMRHRVVATASAAALAAGTAAFAVAPAASAAPVPQAKAPAPTSLADVLLKDTKKGAPSFDRNGQDFDILTAAVLAVLDAKPNSAVSVLTKPNVKLTAFIPNDRGFKQTARVLGIKAVKEAKVTNKLVAALGVNKIEKVLLYHVVPGAKITSQMAAKSDGARLGTALGKKIGVNVTHKGIFIKDANRKVANPKVVAVDINRAPKNKQIAHAINRVLLPF
jgi:uncharacterized surface protein with fasciclin (FAS1) repeats